ncbi:flavin-containing monooxygenase [Chondromyces apiculatus]|uniref:Monooxygenase, putative n=1 Tax=Chondromyces apiculatus DSM 436 TaxID=1192034 RepID=A0A017T748_9BACT|nr:NAD(P)/FAD-dependent oxidoreductase [Chondromyces apiculatus]EYF05058.1 monooxygenase, putative [Chondromyces apiculatus DSM 436]
MTERFDVVVIGGGQSGLAMGHYLARQGRSFVILDGSERVGDAWRRRWDSLRLITPHPYNDLPGLPFPRDTGAFATRDQTAAYLEEYARTFRLPVRLGAKVTALRRGPSGSFAVVMGDEVVEARAVVVATGAFQKPYIPLDRSHLSPEVVQIHSSDYRNPRELPEGDTLVVGCGNSANPIARELSGTRRVYQSLGEMMASPRRFLGRDIFFWLYTLRLMEVTVESRLGRRLRELPEGSIGLTPHDNARDYGVVLLGRTLEVRGDEVTCEGGRTVKVRTIVWATGFGHDYGWIEAPVLDARGAPVHRRGETEVPGLYFLGLKWQYRNGSSLLGGVGRDAEFLAGRLDRHLG